MGCRQAEWIHGHFNYNHDANAINVACMTSRQLNTWDHNHHYVPAQYCISFCCNKDFTCNHYAQGKADK